MERKTMIRVFIDCDNTITPVHGFSEPPSKETIDSINKLYDSGRYEIIIYSCRANPEICDPSDVKKMTTYLIQNGIRFHKIEPNKPLFDYIIDDRSLNPKLMSWADIENIISLSGL